MLYIVAVETNDIGECGDAFNNDIDELTRWICEWLPRVARVRPLSEIVSC